MSWDEITRSEIADQAPVVKAGSDYAIGFEMGAEWQRNALRTDKAVELVARHEYENPSPEDQLHELLGIPETWDELTESAKSDESYRLMRDGILRRARTTIAALIGEEA